MTHIFEYRTRLLHCDQCGVRTTCRILDGVKLCDRCFPISDVEWDQYLAEIRWWNNWTGETM